MTNLLKGGIQLLCCGLGICVNLLHVMLDRGIEGWGLALES